MAKRFTDTDKWKKPFIKSLPLEYKLLWFYILDDCDHAGIWQVDLEVTEIRLGIKLSLSKARGFFGDRIVEFDGGTKWFVPDFIHFQYGSLNEKNKMYKPVIAQLSKYGLMGHLSPINGGKVQVQVKVQEKVKDEGGMGETTVFRIEDCLRIALNDQRWVKANSATETEVGNFNHYLERQGVYEMNPLDYKKYFAKLKGRYPEMLKKELSVDELKWLALEMDQKSKVA